MDPEPKDLTDPQVLASLRRNMQGRSTPLFLDYDGTLTPIVSDPEQATLSEGMRRALEGLARQGTVALVSGRDLQALQRFVALDSVYYAGSHGFEIVGPGGIHKVNEEADSGRAALLTAADELDAALAGVEGATLERKRFALAVHYRNTPEAEVPRVTRAVEDAVARHPGLRYGAGKMVYELQPDVAWDKGRAVLWLLEALGLEGEDALPLYIGDDWTDEHAFEALRGRGAGIFVGEPGRATAAEYRLADVEQVQRFFEALLEGTQP